MSKADTDCSYLLKIRLHVPAAVAAIIDTANSVYLLCSFASTPFTGTGFRLFFVEPVTDTDVYTDSKYAKYNSYFELAA